MSKEHRRFTKILNTLKSAWKNPDGFRSNILMSVVGVVLARAISFGMMPLLARLYPPEHPGVLNLFVSFYALAIPLTTMRYELAVVLPETANEAAHLTKGCVLMAFVVGLLSMVVLFFVGEPLATWAGIEVLGNAIWFAPAFLWLHGITMAASYWLVRHASFRPRLLAAPFAALMVSGLPVALGLWLGPSPLNLLLGSLGGEMISAGVLSIAAWRTSPELWRQKPSWGDLKSVWRKYRAYPIYMAPYSLLQAGVERTTMFLLAGFGSMAALGLYVYAKRLAYIPLNVLSDSMRKAMFARMKQEEDISNLGDFITRFLIQMTQIQAVVLAFGLLHGPWLLERLLGSKWAGAGDYFFYLLFPAVTLLSTAWLDRVFDIQGKPRLAVILQVVSDVLNLGALLVVLLSGRGLVAAVAVYCILDMLYNILWLAIVYRITGFGLRLYGSFLVRFLGLTGAAVLIYYIITVNMPLLWAACVCGVCSVIVGLFTLYSLWRLSKEL